MFSFRKRRGAVKRRISLTCEKSLPSGRLFFRRKKEEKQPMKLVTIHASLLNKYSGDPEILQKSTRPYVLVVRLKYKNIIYNFAIPIRSNIPSSAPKNQYFALPPRPQTRPKNRHGLHYIKMFPVKKQYLVRYRTEGNHFAALIQNIIDKNSKQIIIDCQHYLDLYSQGLRPAYSTDIDYLINQLNQ